MAVTDETLKALGADQLPTIYAYNKADLTDLPYPQIESDNVYLSAKQNSGMAELTALIATMFLRTMSSVRFWFHLIGVM